MGSEQTGKLPGSQEEGLFQLVSEPDMQGELFLKSVLEDMAREQPKRPLQCVTVKMPLPAYLRMKKAAQKWNLTYTDVINFCTQRVVPILETPSGEVAQLLEEHRLEIETKRARKVARGDAWKVS